MTGSFLEEPASSPRVQALYDKDLADGGYVWNVTRLWAHQPGTFKQLFGLISEAFTPAGLTFRQRAVLVTAAASPWVIRTARWPGAGNWVKPATPPSRREFSLAATPG